MDVRHSDARKPIQDRAARHGSNPGRRKRHHHDDAAAPGLDLRRRQTRSMNMGLSDFDRVAGDQ